MFVKADTVKCYECDGVKNEACVSKISADSVCRSVSGKCYTKIMNKKLYRGCVGDKLVQDEQSLEKCLINQRCEICSNDLCNENIYLNTCIDCDSSTNDNCKKNPSDDMQAICSTKQTAPDSECYLKVSDDRIYKRGCGQDLSDSEKSQCQTENNKNCQICTDTNCNKKINFNINCYECDSQTNIGCAKGENLTIVPCNDLSKVCIVGDNQQGHTKRKCARNCQSELHLNFLKGHEICYDDLCNKKPFMKNQRICYQCDGPNCKELKSMDATTCEPNDPLKSDNLPHCFTYVKSGNHFHFEFII